MRELVYPGDELPGQARRAACTFRLDGSQHAAVMGLYDTESASFVPLEGLWTPRQNDAVVGVVSIARPERGVYAVDLCYFGSGVLLVDENRHGSAAQRRSDACAYEVGSVISAEVARVEHRRDVVLRSPKRLAGGSLMLIKPSKVPRVLGRGNTMLRQIMEITACTIVVGLNGLLWLSGGEVAAAKLAILKIEREAHMPGLTESIRTMLVSR